MMGAGKPLETRWGRVPAVAVPLRIVPVTVTRERAAALEDWAARQGPAVAQWVAARAAQYGSLEMGDGDRFRDTARVDLLVWQSGCKGPREALEWWSETQAGVEACAADWRKT